MNNEKTNRTEFLAGLRALVDHLEQHPEVMNDHPYLRLNFVAYNPERLSEMASALGGKREKGGSNLLYTVTRNFGESVSVSIIAPREEVCEARVIGKRIVQKPDPSAPMIDVEEDIIEWECKPILVTETL